MFPKSWEDPLLFYTKHSFILHLQQVATFVAAQAKREYPGSSRYNERGKTNLVAEEGSGDLLEQLQGYSGETSLQQWISSTVFLRLLVASWDNIHPPLLQMRTQFLGIRKEGGNPS